MHSCIAEIAVENSYCSPHFSIIADPSPPPLDRRKILGGALSSLVRRLFFVEKLTSCIECPMPTSRKPSAAGQSFSILWHLWLCKTACRKIDCSERLMRRRTGKRSAYSRPWRRERPPHRSFTKAAIHANCSIFEDQRSAVRTQLPSAFPARATAMQGKLCQVDGAAAAQQVANSILR